MKKTFKGFTLVECLVAMAILAIASTLMAEIYATVSQRNNFNHFTNSSLSNQMKYIEQYTKSKTLTVYFGDSDSYKGATAAGATTKYPPHHSSNAKNSEGRYVSVTRLDDSDKKMDDNTYSFPADIYVMYSRDTHDVGSNNKDANDDPATYSPMYSEKNDNLRYKYVLGHTS
ncbi:MAG: type II secretion system GspH family protein [Oscillospiraceae bacterium]|nr:type II secretion system GspH family protein [Oscillospiraceae bacterium]